MEKALVLCAPIRIAATVVLLSALALPVIAATGEVPSGFRSVKWGSGPSPSMKRLSGPDGADRLEVWVLVSKQLATFLGAPVAEEAYMFTGGKLYSGQVFVDKQGNLGRVRSELTKLYGKPDFANESLKIYKWKWPAQKIEISISYQSKFQRTTVTFTNNMI
jgi:hypothetical protein